MKAINVEGLPEPVAKTLEAMVQALQQQLRGRVEPRPLVELPRWPGKVLGRLTREEIYADVR